jgi:hypothetical protein
MAVEFDAISIGYHDHLQHKVHFGPKSAFGRDTALKSSAWPPPAVRVGCWGTPQPAPSIRPIVAQSDDLNVDAENKKITPGSWIRRELRIAIRYFSSPRVGKRAVTEPPNSAPIDLPDFGTVHAFE